MKWQPVSEWEEPSSGEFIMLRLQEGNNLGPPELFLMDLYNIGTDINGNEYDFNEIDDEGTLTLINTYYSGKTERYTHFLVVEKAEE